MKITLKEDIISHLIEVAVREDNFSLCEDDVPKLVRTKALRNFIALDESDVQKAKGIAIVTSPKSLNRHRQDMDDIQNASMLWAKLTNPHINKFVREVQNTLLYNRRRNTASFELIGKLIHSEFDNDCEVEDVISYCLHPFLFQQWLEHMKVLNAQHIREVQIALSGVKDIRDVKMSDLPERTDEDGVFIRREVV